MVVYHTNRNTMCYTHLRTVTVLQVLRAYHLTPTAISLTSKSTCCTAATACVSNPATNCALSDEMTAAVEEVQTVSAGARIHCPDHPAQNLLRF